MEDYIGVDLKGRDYETYCFICAMFQHLGYSLAGSHPFSESAWVYVVKPVFSIQFGNNKRRLFGETIDSFKPHYGLIISIFNYGKSLLEIN